MGELAYVCLGRTSVFVINFALAIGCSLMVVVYALLFSKICVSLMEDWTIPDSPYLTYLLR